MNLRLNDSIIKFPEIFSIISMQKLKNVNKIDHGKEV